MQGKFLVELKISKNCFTMKSKFWMWVFWFVSNGAIWLMSSLISKQGVADGDIEPAGWWIYYLVPFIISVCSGIACYMDLKDRP